MVNKMYKELVEFLVIENYNKKFNLKKFDLNKVYIGEIKHVTGENILIEEKGLNCEYTCEPVKKYAFFIKNYRPLINLPGKECKTYIHIGNKIEIDYLESMYRTHLIGHFVVDNIQPIETIFTENGKMMFENNGKNSITTKQILQLEKYLNKQNHTKYSDKHYFESDYPELDEIDEELKQCLKDEYLEIKSEGYSDKEQEKNSEQVKNNEQEKGMGR